MPIKFRCVHCRQLLGISRGKAGQPVDCPACGRTVRVPNLDGKTAPVASPGLDLADSSLVQALDQLAMIGQVPADELDAEIEFAGEEVVEQPVALPAPKPVALAPPLPAEPVAPRPETSARSEAAGASAALAELSPFGTGQFVPAGPLAARNALLTTAVVGLAALGLGFAAGFIAGRSGNALPATTAGRSAEPSEHTKENPAAVAVAPAAMKMALRGRITYRTDSGESRPDVGARVIVFPQKRAGEVKLSAAGFRAADSPADFQVAQASLRALGGDVAVVNDEGNFEISLPAAGTYFVLALSRFQPQASEAPPEPGLRSLLDAWFVRPEQLLGRVRHQFGQVRYTGDAVQLWDHSFDRAG